MDKYEKSKEEGINKFTVNQKSVILYELESYVFYGNRNERIRKLK